jgi:hypothetical protein
MTPIEALHTAARRYCIERSALWHERYNQSGVDANSDEARHLVPRYQILEAILTTVEATVPADFGSLEEVQETLMLAGHTAQNWATRSPILREGVAREAIDEERALFGKHLLEFATLAATPGWSDHVKPIPYRRTLGREESSALWARFKQTWNFRSDYWNLLDDTADPPFPYAAFRAGDFEHFVGVDALRALLEAKNIIRVWQLYPFEPTDPEVETEIDLTLMDPLYDHPEAFWTSEAMDWLICDTLDFELIFAGEWLVEAIKAHWPDWAIYALGRDARRYQTPHPSRSEGEAE